MSPLDIPMGAQAVLIQCGTTHSLNPLNISINPFDTSMEPLDNSMGAQAVLDQYGAKQVMKFRTRLNESQRHLNELQRHFNGRAIFAYSIWD